VLLHMRGRQVAQAPAKPQPSKAKPSKGESSPAPRKARTESTFLAYHLGTFPRLADLSYLAEILDAVLSSASWR